MERKATGAAEDCSCEEYQQVDSDCNIQRSRVAESKGNPAFLFWFLKHFYKAVIKNDTSLRSVSFKAKKVQLKEAAE